MTPTPEPRPALRHRLPAGAYAAVFAGAPTAMVVLRADDLVVLEANPTYRDVVGLTAGQLLGRSIFEVFPDRPGPPGLDQTRYLRDQLARAVATGLPQSTRELRYDIPTPLGFVVRYWNLTELPLVDDAGRVSLILHHVEDVTATYEARHALAASRRAVGDGARRVAGLAEMALELTNADSLLDLEDIVVTRGARVLGAAGGSLVTFAEDGSWRITLNPDLDDRARSLYAEIPRDTHLPGCRTARTGEVILLPNQAAGLAFDPIMADVYALRSRDAWAFLPLRVQGRVIGALSVSWVEEHHVTPDELDVLEAFAAQCAQAVYRLQASEAERRTTQSVRELTEELQAAMLTPPQPSARLQIEVRYRAALDLAQVGGDWYDSFQQPDGATMLVIGDVCGHDALAAGKMGQLRGLLRAMAYDARTPAGPESPASILTRFEYAARGLDVDELATVVLARIEPGSGPETSVVSWSNAGNPPPVVIDPDGTTRLLEPEQDLLVGIDPATPRHDHRVELATGATLLLYTDGLVERRDGSIDEGITHLRDALAAAAGAPLGEMCDLVLHTLAPMTGEDDIALLAVRAATPDC